MGVKIRAVEAGDIDAIMVMARAMHAESPRYNHIPFIDADALQAIKFTVQNDSARVAEEDGKLIGMIGGVKVNYFFNHSASYTTDMVVYVAPDKRGSSVALRLIRTFEAWSEAQPDVVDTILGVSTEIEAERTVLVYQRLGYRLSGHSLIKTRTLK